ncbi:HEAT repeat domain-containing protein [Fischerella sp. PCC 9605]|uniref:HEAT repeat domain-containing protein n=1 Tax=Fischerella sp. PCC 9605 TaxID=1173024 RepID=UPI0009E2969E|nr:HEAT repeat domain-containing protein [Fischerella sp. PCC 9605]
MKERFRKLTKYKTLQVRSVIESLQALPVSHSIRNGFIKCCTKFVSLQAVVLLSLTSPLIVANVSWAQLSKSDADVLKWYIEQEIKQHPQLQTDKELQQQLVTEVEMIAYIELLKNADPEIRLAAINFFKSSLKNQSGVHALIKILQTKNSQLRSDAVHGLFTMRSEAIPGLIVALQDKQAQIRSGAAYALSQIGKEANAAIPDLTVALQDKDKLVRYNAAIALSRVENVEISVSVKYLENTSATKAKLQDKNARVRYNAAIALASFGKESQNVVPILIEALQDKDTWIRSNAASALGYIGKDADSAVPALIVALQDKDESVRSSSAYALSNIGEKAQTAIPALIVALQDKDESVRSNAASALGSIGKGTKQAKMIVTVLIKVWQEDQNVRVRSSAISALGNFAKQAQVVIPPLIVALQDQDEFIRSRAASALAQIAGDLQEEANTLSYAELDKVIKDLEKALKILADPQLKPYKTQISTVSFSIETLKYKRDLRIFDRAFAWMKKNQWAVGTVIYLIFFPSLWLLLLRVHPLWLLRINDALKPYTDFSLPVIGIKVPLRTVLFLSLFHYHPRVLDAWVAAHLKSVQEEFQEKDTVRARKVHIPIPVILDGKTVAQLTANELRSSFKKQRGCLPIWGEGGAGKTSLACQIAKWAISEDEAERLCEHQMLPLLIEEELDLETVGKPPLMAAIQGQLQDLTNEPEPISDELLERLLRHRRILVIIDHFSEMGEVTRKAIRPDSPDFCINALVITSRFEEKLGQVTKTTLKPLRIAGNRLSSFMEAYLMQRGKRDCFTDTEFFDACSRLSTMVGARNITVLLAKLYAEQLIAAKEGTSDGQIPENIPDLMLFYVNELNRSVTGDRYDNRTVHQDAQAIAWECIQTNFRPAAAKKDDALTTLNIDDSPTHLKYLEERLRLIQTIGAAQDQIRFALDPLAEYLAGLHLLKLYGDDEQLWQQFFQAAVSKPGAPDLIKGFLLALRDCCIAKGKDANVPDFVVEELDKLTGFISSRKWR